MMQPMTAAPRQPDWRQCSGRAGVDPTPSRPKFLENVPVPSTTVKWEPAWSCGCGFNFKTGKQLHEEHEVNFHIESKRHK